jgi:hypothetical protein
MWVGSRVEDVVGVALTLRTEDWDEVVAGVGVLEVVVAEVAVSNAVLPGLVRAGLALPDADVVVSWARLSINATTPAVVPSAPFKFIFFWLTPGAEVSVAVGSRIEAEVDIVPGTGATSGVSARTDNTPNPATRAAVPTILESRCDTKVLFTAFNG